MSSFSTEPVFDSYLAVALITLGLSTLLFFGPRFGHVTPLKRLTLVGLRLLVILLVLLALLQPTKITTVKTKRTSVLLLLFDVSRSMQLPSGGNSTEGSRWKAQKELLEKSQPKFATLAANYDLKVSSFDSALHPIEQSGGKFKIPEKPLGMSSDYGTPLYDAVRGEQGRRLAGVMLLGDGRHTAYAPQVEVQEAGRKLRDDFAAPLYTVPFGPAADAASARDVAVERLDEQFTVFVKNELQVKGLIRVRGYVKTNIPVELELVDSMGQKQAIGKKSIRADEDGRQMEVAFTFTPQQPGHYRLYLKAERQLGELVEKNNELSAYLTVLEGGLRVLYLDGEKWHEQRFLRQSLNASPDIELDDRIIDRRNKQKIDITEDVRKGRYDAFILRDLDARLLTSESLQLLADQVGKGKGLLMLGGDPGSFGFGHYQETPLGAALPIEFDELEGKPNLGAGKDRFFLKGPLPMIPVGSHPLTRLAPDAENNAAWKKLPPLNWAHKFKDVKEGPGVRILLETAKHEPLLVSGEFGSGRVLAFAGESTYLWPMHGFEKEHKRFWRQVVLWLVKRDDLNKDDVWIKLDQRRFNPGSRVIITTGARTSTGDVVTGATVETIISLPSKKQQPLKLTKGKDGNFTGSLEVTEPGDYSVETAATAGGKPLGKARAEFMVFDRDVELSNPAADPDQLASLAAWTKQDGGKLVQPEQFSALLDELAAKPPEFEERQIKWKLGSTPADAWPLFLLLTCFLSVEWFLRKKWGLV
jgi:uncharacterized membrane protein